MTYCVGVSIDQGIVLASDSRTNAGIDNVASVSKMHTFETAPDRVFVLMSAGNLATTQEVLDHLNRDLANAAPENLNSCKYMFEVAEYIGRLNQQVQSTHSQALQLSGVSGEATFILGGQIRGQEAGLFMIYPQGNYICASEDTPFMQIGETKYGKPVLERLVEPEMSLEDAARVMLVSLDSTARSNLSVGAPFEVVIITRDSLVIRQHLKYSRKSSELRAIRHTWHAGLKDLFHSLPKFEWELNEFQQPLPIQTQPVQNQPVQLEGAAQQAASTPPPSFVEEQQTTQQQYNVPYDPNKPQQSA